MLKKAFLYRKALHELKNAFIAKPKDFLLQKALRTVLKSRLLYVQKAFYAHNPFLMLSKATLFHPPQPIPTDLNLLSTKISRFYKSKAFLSHKPFLLPPKAILFHPPLPISTPLNLLSTKEYSCSFDVRSTSLRCKARTSHRFKSLPAIPGEVAAFRKTGYLMSAGHFSKNLVSTGDLNRPRSPEVRKPLVCFLVLFAQRKKHEKRSFRREFRGSANLDSARRNN